ncbi:MAG: hypothetical protein AAF676_06320 [Pseudomonadota bacterium]
MKALFLAAAVLAGAAGSAQALIISAGAPTLELEGFQPGPGGDVFELDLASFGAATSTVFVNANPSVDGLTMIDPLPADVTPIIVVQGRDRFGDAPSDPFLAGTAGFEIADALQDDPGRKGFFLYWNSIQQRNRLVFSEDITRQAGGLGDLTIVAAIASGGQGAALSELPDYAADNFSAVPIPAAGPLLAAALLAGAALRRRRRAG